MILPKENKIVEVFFSIIKNGLVNVEGKKWKHRRKLISKVFNFDFITSLVPEMIEIADNIFDDFEKKMDNNSETKVNLFAMMLNFASSVVVSGFLGFDAIKDKYKD
jgi:cytochrome P450